MNDKAMDREWWQRANFYSLYIDKFAGDIPTLTKRLDYFQTLGIDCLHILPHYPSPMTDDGFDITDHTGVRPELGTVSDVTQLCQTAQQKNLKIMVDLVLNHVSSEHPWFVNARSSKDDSKRDWFLWSETATEFSQAPNIFPDFKPSNWIYNEATDDYYYATFKPTQPDLNWSNPAVLTAMLQVIDELVAQGVNGFRLDAIMNLVEAEGTNSTGIPATHDRIRDIRAYIDTYHPGIILLGEIVGTTRDSKRYFGQSDECHLSYNFELMNEMLYALKCGGRPDRLRAVVEAARELTPQASWMAFLRNHDSLILNIIDQERSAELLDALDPKRVYSFAGGTQTVQRLASLLGEDRKLIEEAFLMLYGLPSATVMYYGDEIGMVNQPLPEGEDDMRVVVRGLFDWEEAQKQMADPASLFTFVRRCIQKRK